MCGVNPICPVCGNNYNPAAHVSIYNVPSNPVCANCHSKLYWMTVGATGSLTFLVASPQDTNDNFLSLLKLNPFVYQEHMSHFI